MKPVSTGSCPPPGASARCVSAWPFWARGKRSIVLDLAEADDLAVVHELAKTSDVVIESFQPGVADRESSPIPDTTNPDSPRDRMQT